LPHVSRIRGDRGEVATIRKLAVALACFLGLALPSAAQAAYPGANGKINFVRSPGGAHFMNPDGSAQAPASNWGIWSPDASRVLRYCDNAFCVYRADGTFESDHYFAAAMHGVGWSPDGTQIVHAEQQCGASVCDPDSIHYQGYPAGPAVAVSAQDDLQPAWSPDGTRIAFVSYREDPRNLCIGCGPAGGSTELYVSNVDGTGPLRLTNSPGDEGGPTQIGIDDPGERFGLPSWSPDATKIAVASNRDGNWEIYVVDADGSGEQRLTSGAATDWKPVWSPDGAKIAFQTNRDGNEEIYSMNPDGSGQTNLTNNAAGDILYDWLSAKGPVRSDYRNAKKFCRAERAFLGKAAFRQKYGPRRAFRNCVTQNP
jgi:WD40-like Beta Propeller Repeat